MTDQPKHSQGAMELAEKIHGPIEEFTDKIAPQPLGEDMTKAINRMKKHFILQSARHIDEAMELLVERLNACADDLENLIPHSTNARKAHEIAAKWAIKE